ncbi:MAG: IS21 family transposase [Actinomycetales bacterium]|nr:IS21 family transposase [Actinomycetales bacterium]
MEILEAFDATGCAHSAAGLAGVDPKTVRRYVAAREAGLPPTAPLVRAKMLDPYLPKIAEWVERSEGKVRADKVHQRLVGMGFAGDERTTRRAVAAARSAWWAGHRRTYRPWITEPGLWLQFDWGTGPLVPGPDGRPRSTWLFCAWLAWSRFRVVIPTWDRKLETLLSCLDSTVRQVGGVPSYALTDNEKTVTVEHIAGVPVRHPTIVAASRHYGTQVITCVPFDPESKGGSEATVRIAKADLLPTEVNLGQQCVSFAALQAACVAWGEQVNARTHRETAAVPAQALLVERARLHPLPATPFTAALGVTRTVNTDQTIRFGSVRYSTPPGHVGAEVWVRVDGEELVVVANTTAGLIEIARHTLSTPGRPRIDLGHYPGHPQHPDGAPRPPTPKARTGAEEAFLGLGLGAHSWLIEAAAAGAQRVRSKMAAALELAALVGIDTVDAALGVAAAAGRFGDGDTLAIVTHQAAGAPASALVIPDDSHSAQPGTSAWAALGATGQVNP